MRIENNSLVFDSDHEKELYLDLKEFLLAFYHGKRNLKRLVNNISFYMDSKEKDFFKGFVFCAQGALSCWGITENGKDAEKDGLYSKFTKCDYDELMNDRNRKESLVCYAICVAYGRLVEEMKNLGLVE